MTSASPSILLSGLRILESFTAAEPALRVGEIAERLGTHKSTVSRTLATLEEAGYVERDAQDRRYRLGWAVVSLAGPLLARLDVRHVALPELKKLTEATLESSALVVPDRGAAVIVELVPSPLPVKHVSDLGTRYVDPHDASVVVFSGSLVEGLALNDGATSPHEVGIAAPVRDHRGDIVAGVLLAAPRFRYAEADPVVVAAAVRETALSISRRLGAP